MAERRMFAKTIVLSDAFLDMPMSARCLYFTLGMLADDDGFVNAPRSIMRQCGSSEDDMRILISKRFVLEFDNGVIVIKHWRINNYLRNDRYSETKYSEEKKKLSVDEKGAYHVLPVSEVPLGIPGGIPCGIPSIGKDRIGKDNILHNVRKTDEKDPIEEQFEAFWSAYGKKDGKKDAIKAFKRISPDEELFGKMMDGVERYHKTRKWQDGFRMMASTWLNGEHWNDEYRDTAQTGKTVSAQQYKQRDYTEEELDAVGADLIAEAKALKEIKRGE